MDTKIFGFAGIESYDLIFYAANLASQLDCTVLLVDASSSNDKSLMHVTRSEFEENSLIKFNGFSFISTRNPKLLRFDNYDYVFIYYGKTREIASILADELYIVTDYQRHNYMSIQYFEDFNACKFIVVRDRSYYNFSDKFLLEEFPGLKLNPEDIFSIEDTEAEVSTRLLLHHSANYKLNKIGSSMREFIYHLFDVDFDKKQLSNAWKAISRR